MRKMKRTKRLSVTGALVLLSSTVLLSAGPVHADNLEAQRNPFTVKVTDEASATLRDDRGTEIPLARDRVQGDDAVTLPSLLPGTYSFSDGDTSTKIEVGSDIWLTGELLTTPPPAKDMLPVGLVDLAVVAAVVLVSVLLRRYRLAVPLSLLTLGVLLGVNHTVGGKDVEPPVVQSCLKLVGDLPAQRSCVLERVTYLLEKSNGDPITGIAELKVADSWPACHEVAHELGRRAWAVNGKAILEGSGWKTCGQGFTHGVEESASVYLDDESYLGYIEGFCSGAEHESEAEIAQCAHGVGHGVMRRFAGDPDRSIATCEQLPGLAPEVVQECAGAAIMEHARLFTSARGDQARKPLPDLAIPALCETVDISYALSCFSAMASVGEVKRDVSLKALNAECRKSAEAGTALRKACITGVSLFVFRHETEPVAAAASCKGYPEGEYVRCLWLAGLNLKNRYHTENIDEVCKAAGVADLRRCRGTYLLADPGQ